MQFAEEGKLFARKMLNQREIEIDFIHANGGAEGERAKRASLVT
jgi:hypothetical protein